MEVSGNKELQMAERPGSNAPKDALSHILTVHSRAIRTPSSVQVEPAVNASAYCTPGAGRAGH